MSGIATLRRNMIFGAAAVGAGALLAVVRGPGSQDGDEPEDGEEAYSTPDFEDAYYS